MKSPYAIMTKDGWKSLPVEFHHVDDDHKTWWKNAFPFSKEYDKLFGREYKLSEE
mgnify:CR=1 FL=1